MIKFQISFPDTGKAHGPFFTQKDFLTPTYFLRIFFPPSHFYKQDTHTHLLYIHIHSCADILYYCTQLVQMQCTSVYTTHINGTHTDIAHIDLCTDILYTICTQLYTAVQLDATYTHLWCTHYAWISCTAVRLYCSPVTVHMYYRTCKFVLTNESPSKMNRVDQSQL